MLDGQRMVVRDCKGEAPSLDAAHAAALVRRRLYTGCLALHAPCTPAISHILTLPPPLTLHPHPAVPQAAEDPASFDANCLAKVTTAVIKLG